MRETVGIYLEVSSLEAFSEFYVDTIGFEVQTEVPDALFIGADEYHHHLGANTWNHRSKPVGSRGLSWLEMVLPKTEALDVIQDRTADSQYPVTEADDENSVTGPDDIEVRFRV